QWLIDEGCEQSEPKGAAPLTDSLAFVCPSPAGQALEKKVVKSKVGEKVSLPCCHEIPSSESLRKYRVYWQKNITDVVLAYSEGNMLPQHERYQNRTEMDPRNLTLWISPVEILDNGSYQCVVQRNSVLVCSESIGSPQKILVTYINIYMHLNTFNSRELHESSR
uniref:Uncharacterized protein n=1 Tax=Geospiza parvula TaxID=87175 RepID=A0A8C3MKY6_GEOPR